MEGFVDGGAMTMTIINNKDDHARSMYSMAVLKDAARQALGDDVSIIQV